jgi:hypothetical protein
MYVSFDSRIAEKAIAKVPGFFCINPGRAIQFSYKASSAFHKLLSTINKVNGFRLLD